MLREQKKVPGNRNSRTEKNMYLAILSISQCVTAVAQVSSLHFPSDNTTENPIQ